VNANLSDYLMPVNADVPALDAHFLTARDDIADPIGVKGLAQHIDTTDSSRSHRARWPTGLARHSKPHRPAEIAPAVESDAQM
jgi:hypothetical protein